MSRLSPDRRFHDSDFYGYDDNSYNDHMLAEISETIAISLPDLLSEDKFVRDIRFGFTSKERITREEELVFADIYLQQFGVDVAQFQEEARRLMYRVGLGFYGVEEPLKQPINFMVPDDMAATFGLWFKGSINDSTPDAQSYGVASDSLVGFSGIHLLLKPESPILAQLPPNALEIVDKPNFETQLQLVHRLMAYVLGGCELVSQVGRTWRPENIERTKNFHEANIRAALALGKRKISFHLSFLDNKNLTVSPEQVRPLNHADEIISGSNRQGVEGEQKRQLSETATQDCLQQIEFLGEMKKKYGIEDLVAVLHLGIVGKKLTESEFTTTMDILETEILPFAELLGIELGIEIQGLTIEQYQRFFVRFPKTRYPFLIIVFDMAHAQIEFSDEKGEGGIEKIWEEVKERVRHIHVAQTIRVSNDKGEFIRHADMHPRLSVGAGGISKKTMQWLINEALERDPRTTVTIEAPPHAEDLLWLLNQVPTRNLLEAGMYDLPIRPLDLTTDLLTTEISKHEIELAYSAFCLFYGRADVSDLLSGESQSDEEQTATLLRNRLAWAATNEVTAFKRTEIHQDRKPIEQISARLGELLDKFQPVLDHFNDRIALSRHTAILIMLLGRLTSLQKELHAIPDGDEELKNELTKKYDNLERIICSFGQEVNDLDVLIVGKGKLSPRAIHVMLKRFGLQERTDPDKKTGRGRNGAMQENGLSRFYGGESAARFKSLFGSGVYHFVDDPGTKVEVMAGFAIPVPGYSQQILLSEFARKLGIPETVTVKWAGKTYRVLHPILTMLSYHAELETYEELGPNIFALMGGYGQWAEKRSKASQRQRLPFFWTEVHSNTELELSELFSYLD